MKPTPTALDGATIRGSLFSLGFVDITGIKVVSRDEVVKVIDFTAVSNTFRGRWGHTEKYIAVIDPDGKVYLRCRDQDIVNGPLFQEVIEALGCRYDTYGAVVADCTPGPGRQFESHDLLQHMLRSHV